MRKHRTTEERRAVVKKMASMMLKREEISSLLSISSKTLERRYRKEIDEGRAQARLSVEAVIYKRVTSGDKGMATAHLQRWWMDRNFPVESKDAGGMPQSGNVVVYIPDNGRDPQLNRKTVGPTVYLPDKGYGLKPATTKRRPLEIEGKAE